MAMNTAVLPPLNAIAYPKLIFAVKARYELILNHNADSALSPRVLDACLKIDECG